MTTRVHLTFDVEVWCPSWNGLDDAFPAAFERYVFGQSWHGAFALPRTLQILTDHGLQGVFFVEPLFALRFGGQHLRTITHLIQDAGHDVQLHLHPEWVDEIRPPLLPDVSRKRQHLTHYSLDEQTALIQAARHTLEAATGTTLHAFRAGSYAVNADTFKALQRAGLQVDSSLNVAFDHSAGSIDAGRFGRVQRFGDVVSYPVTTFRDGFRRQRPLQVGACSFGEMRDVLLAAHDVGCEHVVLVSHNFEMLKPGTTQPDFIVVRRFERLCAFLAAERQRFVVCSYPRQPDTDEPATGDGAALRASIRSTGQRFVEQAIRRLR